MKRSVSILLTVCLILSVLTNSALAVDVAGDSKNGQATEASEAAQTGLATGKGEEWQEVLDDQKIAEQENGISPQVEGILITDKHYYESGEEIEVTGHSTNAGAWVGLYPASTTTYGTSIAWFNCSGTVELRKSATWNGSKELEGPYKVVLFGDSGFTNVLQSYYFFVGPVTVSTKNNQTTYCINEPILVSTNYNQWEGWVGMHKSGVTPGSGNSVYSYYPVTNNNMPGMGLSNVNILGGGSGIMTGGTAYGTGTFVIGVFEHSAGYNRIASTTITVRNHSDSSTDSDHKCDYCGAANVTGHTYDQKNTSGTYLKSAATCTSAAVYYYSCRCGTKGTSTFESGNPIAHTYNQKNTSGTYLKSSATCTSAAVYYYSCTCGAKGTSTFTSGNALGHSWTNATCTTAKTCSRCKVTEGSALGHSWTNATCTTAKTCSVCNATEGAALGHNWTDATCTTAKTCSVCKATEGEALGHNWGDYTLIKVPTHTEAGEIGRVCTICGEVDSESIAPIKKLPRMDLQVEFTQGYMVLTGIYDDYANLDNYLPSLRFGIVLVPTGSLSGELSLNTAGRTKIEFSEFKNDGTFRYFFKPAGDEVSYSARAFVSYPDPATGEEVILYSDILEGSYTACEGRTLTTVPAQAD